MEINKELIKNVLAKETENLSDDFTFDIKDNYILFADDGESQFEVNVYEFAFKCKEWAFKNEFTILTYKINKYDSIFSTTINAINFKWEDLMHKPDMILKTYDVGAKKTEIEAIIKACEWILEQSK